MRGDILFYVASSNVCTPEGLFERLIQWRTRGPYVHVEVDMGDGTSVGALSGGVERHLRPAPAAWAGVGSLCPSEKLATALTWLADEVGTPYGWGDIADAALGKNLPTGLPGAKPRYDCSHLALCFLVVAGYPYLPPRLVSAPNAVSPNDLARALGLMK